MAKPSIYRICDTHEEGKEVWMKSTKRYEETCKIINVYQIKISNMCDTMDFCVDEIVEILETFGYQNIDEPVTDSYWNIDLFEVWERGCSSKCPYLVIEEDLGNPKYNNILADNIMKVVFKRTMEYYEKEYPTLKTT